MQAQVLTATQRRRADIVAAALRVFLAGGYGASSIDIVAREAGVSKPTIYKHFESKEQLFAAVMDALAGQRIALLNAGDLGSMAPPSALKAYADQLLSLLLTPTSVAFQRLIIAEAGNFPEMQYIFDKCACHVLRDILRIYLEKQAALGHLTVANADRATSQFKGMLMQPLYWPVVTHERPLPGPDEIDAAKAEAIRLFLSVYGPEWLDKN